MTMIFRNLLNGLRFWPIFRFMCIFAFLVFFCEIELLAIAYIHTGAVPSVKDVHLLFFDWHFSGGISHLWDILMFPTFVYLSYVIEDTQKTHNGIDVIQFGLLVSMTCSGIFGILYAIPVFVVVVFLWIAVVVILVTVSGMKKTKPRDDEA